MKRLHRYNEREEQMRVEMMLRRSWARYRRRAKRGFRQVWAITWAESLEGWLVPATAKVDNPQPGISGSYVWEWPAYPIDKNGGQA